MECEIGFIILFYTNLNLKRISSVEKGVVVGNHPQPSILTDNCICHILPFSDLSNMKSLLSTISVQVLHEACLTVSLLINCEFPGGEFMAWKTLPWLEIGLNEAF